jgi:hypothetical protein
MRSIYRMTGKKDIYFAHLYVDPSSSFEHLQDRSNRAKARRPRFPKP